MSALAMNQMMGQYNMQPGVQGGGGNSSGYSNAMSGYSSDGTSLAQSGNSAMSAFAPLTMGG